MEHGWEWGGCPRCAWLVGQRNYQHPQEAARESQRETEGLDAGSAIGSEEAEKGPGALAEVKRLMAWPHPEGSIPRYRGWKTLNAK